MLGMPVKLAMLPVPLLQLATNWIARLIVRSDLAMQYLENSSQDNNPNDKTAPPKAGQFSV